MPSSLEQFMDMGGEVFIILRDGRQAHEAKGLPNHERPSGRSYVGFLPGTDVRPGDWIRGKTSGNEFYVVDTVTDVVHGKPFQLKAFCLTRAELAQRQRTEVPTFSIQTAVGSIIGTQMSAHVVFTLPDLEALVRHHGLEHDHDIRLLIDELKKMERQPAVTKGCLARFSDLLAKHAWLSSAVAQALLSWLLSK